MAYIPENPNYTGLTNFDHAIAYKIPTWFDVNGQQHYNYATIYGPHSGKTCDCAECKKFNDEFSNRAEQQKLLDKVHKEAYDTFCHYLRQSGLIRVDGSSHIDANTALQITVNFCKKQIAEYQQEMVRKVQNIQLEHTARIERVMAQQNKMADVRMRRDMEKRKAGEHDGRMFRVGEQEETE